MQSVGELDQDDADIRRHRDHHLAVILGLRLVAGLERQPRELGDAVDEARDLLAERLTNLLQRGRGVLDRVVKQRSAKGCGVQPHPRADLRHADGMDDELLAGLAALVGVVDARVHECLFDPRSVDHQRRMVGVLLDDREQVRQELALDRRQLRSLDRRRRRRAAVEIVDQLA